MLRLRVAAALLLSAAAAATASAGADQYAAGVREARAGHYAAALEYFQAASRAGYDSPALSYNLGVVNYRLDRPQPARRAFRALLEQPSWQPLAHFNLGLVEASAGRSRAARAHFEQAHKLAGDPKLAALAAEHLAGVQSPDAAAAGGWHGLLSTGAGYDDNVLLVGDRLADAASGQGDTFAELLGAGGRPVWLGANAGWRLDAVGYFQAHAELDDYDFGSVAVSLLRTAAGDGMDWATGLDAEAQFAGGRSYANLITHRLRLESGRNTRLRTDNVLSYVFAGADFDYVGGWRNRTRLLLEQRRAASRIRLGYEIEINDREDLALGPEFFSYSPLEQTAFGALQLTVAPRLVLDLEAAYTRSNYPDDNRFVTADGTLETAARDQDLTVLALRTSYLLSARWNLWSRLEHARSTSDIDRYDYTSVRWLVGIERLF